MLSNLKNLVLVANIKSFVAILGALGGDWLRPMFLTFVSAGNTFTSYGSNETNYFVHLHGGISFSFCFFIHPRMD